MSRIPVLTVILLTFVLLAGAAAVAGDNPTFAEPDDVDADTVRIEITLDSNGDAVWTVTYRVLLEDDADREGFEDLRADIEEDPGQYEAQYQERMQSSAGAASEATGREMQIEDMQVSAETRELPETHGVVEYEFRWTNFADRENGTMLVGDAIDGLFLDDRTVLLIGWPEGWHLQSVSPAPEERDRAVVWEGPIEFGTGEPRVTIAEDSLVTMNQALLGMVLLAAIGLIAWLVIVGGWRPGAGLAEEEEAPGSAEETIDSDLLSNEEQVLQLIEQHDGRMKQRDVAEELGWTAAKTSQVTRELRETGRLEGFRLGRENVLRLPEEEE